MRQRYEKLLHKPARWVYKRAFLGFVGKKNRDQRALDFEVARGDEYCGALDKRRRHGARELAGMDEEL